MKLAAMYCIYNFILLVTTIALAPLIGMLLLIRRKYRSGFLQKCGLCSWRRLRAPLKADPVWVHAVSVGEVMAAVPLIRQIKKQYPHLPVLLSTVTETGYVTARRNAKSVDQIVYFPFDYSFVVRRAIACIRPCIFVTLETEIWPNFLRELRRQHTPAMIVSGRISSKSFQSYKLFRAFFKRVLVNIDCICMQTQTDASRIIGMGAVSSKVTVTGNIKFDHQVPAITPEESRKLFIDLHINAHQNVLIAGSTHRGEEDIIIGAYEKLKKKIDNLVLILAPRHPERFDEVASLLKSRGVCYRRKTAMARADDPVTGAVILLDTIGELAKTYSVGTVIFIGGSLVPVGGHNVLEPAVFSKPVMFGPHMGNFAEIARILTEKQAAIQVTDGEQLEVKAAELLGDPVLRERVGARAFSVIQENSGALDRSMQIMAELLRDNRHRPV